MRTQTNALILWIFPFLLMSFGAAAQTEVQKFVQSDSIIGKIDLFSVDNLGRINIVRNDIIRQLDRNFDTLYSASLKTMRPTSIESAKTFRTLVFDQERGVLHFLDNTLTDIHGEITLYQLDILQPILACESFAGNSFWVLDASQRKLLKLDENLHVINQTENLFQVFDKDTMPERMIESSDYLYMLLPKKGVVIFDIFGTFIKFYETAATQIGVYGNYLLIQEGTKIEAISNKTFKSTGLIYSIPKGVSQFHFAKDKIYLLTKRGLLVGQFKK
jgi:hypothetical protein